MVNISIGKYFQRTGFAQLMKLPHMGGLVQIFKLNSCPFILYGQDQIAIFPGLQKKTVSKFITLMMDKKVLAVQMRNERICLTCGRYVPLDEVWGQGPGSDPTADTELFALLPNGVS